MQNDKLVSGKLEEYRALRAEIVALMTRQGQHLTLGWTGAAALISVAALSKHPEVAALSVLFVAASWYDYLKMSAGIARLGEYIEVCVEPFVSGLFWETCAHRIYSETVAERPWIKRFGDAFASSYGVFGLIALGIAILLSVTLNWENVLRKSLTISFVAAAGARFLFVAISAANHPKRRGNTANYLRKSEMVREHLRLQSSGGPEKHMLEPAVPPPSDPNRLTDGLRIQVSTAVCVLAAASLMVFTHIPSLRKPRKQ